LQAELDKAESELAEKKQELRALKDYIRTEAAEMVAKKKRLISANFIFKMLKPVFIISSYFKTVLNIIKC